MTMSTTKAASQGGGGGLYQTTSQLQSFFSTCDKQGKGYIVQEELRELCAGLAIAVEDSDVIFLDLDQDQDGKISYNEFTRGFTEFLNPKSDLQTSRRLSICKDTKDTTEDGSGGEEGGGDGGEEGGGGGEGRGEVEKRRRENVFQAWNNLTHNLTDLSKAPLRPESCAQIRDLLQDLESSSAPIDVAGRVSSVLSSLLQEIQHLHAHHHSLEKLYKKEKEHHVSALKTLEDELEDQVAKVEQRAKQKARQESEEEKRQLQDQMENEMAELQTHLKIFQKVDTWLRREENEGGERVEEVRRKLEEAYHANRSLHLNLSETNTNLGLMRSDLAQMRLQYEEKCHELHNERETVLEYMHQYDHMKRQLQLLHDANKRLQDTNDSIRGAMEGEWRRSPLGSRASSTRSSSLHRHKDHTRSHSRSRSPQVPVLSSLDSEGGLNYGIRRLMDDLDSGLSTLPDASHDPTHPHDDLKFSEHDGPMSLEEELLSLESHSPSETQRAEGGHNTPPSHHTSTPTPPPPILEITTPKLKPRRVAQLERNGTSLQYPHRGSRTSPFEAVGPPERTYKVVFAGDAAVGKSTFIVRLCKGCFVINIASTLGVDYKVKTLCVDEKNIAIQLWDTAGQERFRSITKTYFRRADGVLLLYDVTSERSFLNVRQWIQSIDDACELRVPVVLCGNKVDLRESGTGVARETGERLARETGAIFFETSCKSGAGVVEALVQLARQMVTTEDVEVQTSALRVCASDQKRSCCGSK